MKDPSPPSRPFWHHVQAHAARAPQAAALVETSTGRRWTWRELLGAAMGCAHALRAHGVERGARVVVLAHNAPELFALFLACERLGAVYAPMNTRWSAAQHRSVLERSRPGVVVADHAHAASLAALTSDVRALDALTHTQAEAWPQAPESSGEQALGLMFTSGTTGHPKGVLLSGDAMRANAQMFVRGLGLGPDDVHHLSAPMFHVGGLCALSLPLLIPGGCTLVAASFDPGALVDHFERARAQGAPVTCMFMVPTMWHRLLKDAAQADTWSTLRVALVGGAAASPALLEAWEALGCPLTIGYGMTESGPMCTFRHPDDPVAHPMDVGRWPPEMGVRVEPDASGEAGRVWLRGPNLMMGYDAPLGPDRSSFQGAWMRSQDLGRLSPTGALVLCGRAHDMIITGGENVYPLEVESALAQVLGRRVERVVVVGLEDEDLGQRVVALVQPRDPTLTHFDLTPSQRLRLDALVPRFARPRAYMVAASLPCGPTGKIDRAAAQALIQPPLS